MNRNTKIALAFVAFSGALGAAALAQGGRHGQSGAGMMPPLELLDADKNGDVTMEEFTKVANERFTSADTDKDSKLTVAEVAAEIEKMRSERMAKRFIARLDANDDGVLTQEESANAQKKMFAMLDRNDDGKIVASERPGSRHGWGRKHRDGAEGGDN